MKKVISGVAAAGLLGLAPAALAAPSDTPETRFYVAPMLSASFSDSATFDPDENLNGGQLSLGKNFGDYFALELYAFHFNDTQIGDQFDSDSDLDVTGYGASALFFPARDVLPIFAVVGAGVGTHDFDGLDSASINDQDTDYYDVGVGYMHQLNDYGVKLRAEYRYRSTDVESAGDGDFHFRDDIVSVGLQIPLSAPPEEPVPEPEPAPAPAQPLDSDGDGVIDANDQCPGTPRGVEVDARGCPIEKEAPVVLRGVTFEFDSARLTAQAENRLDNVIAALNASPDVEFRIEGHTDYIGTEAYNQDLSERRAQSVKDYLVSHGISTSRITAVVGYGEARPVATNETAAGRAQNRRVELHVTQQ